MRYEPIDPEIVQEVIDGIHPHKDVEEIKSDLGQWSNFLVEIIGYIRQVIAELKEFLNGN